MSKFKVMSRKECENYCKQATNPTFVIISISTQNDIPYANFQNSLSLKDVLYLHFNDVEDNDLNHKHYAITDKDAELIYNFAYYYFENKEVKDIIIHCDAGVSRSAGVAAALMNIFEDNDWPIFDNPNYCPNMTCYRKVLECHYPSLDKSQKEEIDKKLNRNIEIWRDKEGI